MKKIFGVITLILSTSAFAWDLGDSAYIYNGTNDGGGVKFYARVEINDIRGDKVKVQVKENCWEKPIFGTRVCGEAASFTELYRKVGESFWTDKSNLQNNWP